MIEIFRTDPHPRILDGYGITIRFTGLMELKNDLTAIWESINGIHDQIQEDLLELVS